MLRKRRRGYFRRRTVIRFFVLLIVAVLALGPFLWHVSKVQEAVAQYNLSRVEEELNWFKVYGGPLNRSQVVRDASLWLRLNLGDVEGLDNDLASFTDDKHAFWLLELYLQQDRIEDAKRIVERIGNKSIRSLGEGLIALSQGNAQEAEVRLKEVKVQGLQKNEQLLTQMGLVQSAIMQGDEKRAAAELATAQNLGSDNPAYLRMSLSLALWQNDWARAQKIVQSIDHGPLAAALGHNPLYLIQKALIFIRLEDGSQLAEVLAELNKLPQAKPYIDYVKGIEAYSQKDLMRAKSLLQAAISEGLQGNLKQDALSAIAQASERQNADRVLVPVLAGKGD